MTSPQTAQSGFQQRQFGTLTVIGWTGENREDGKDMPFLLAYSTGNGADGPAGSELAARRLLREAGLPVGGEVVDGTSGRQLPVSLLVQAGQAVLTLPHATVQYPATPEWLAAAADRGFAYFLFSTKPWPQGASGRTVGEDELRAFVDENMMRNAAHCLLPVRSLQS